METSTEKLIRLLLFYPRNRWKQTELAERADCSRAFVSKLTKKMIFEGVLARPKPQEIILLNNTKLLNLWCSLRKLPKPIYIKTKFSKSRVERMLRKERNYCLTLFSAAWHRVKFMKTNKTELYADKRNIRKFIEKFGKVTRTPTNFIIFPSDSDIFENSEKINGLCLANIIQDYVDLISIGGTGVRVAHELDKKYNLGGI